jgi:GMP synthase (glutamine-hydrolysing)
MGEQTAPASAPQKNATRQGAVLVVDFGAQYAQLIARRVREAHVYSEIVPHHMPVAEMLAKQPAAIILSGGPSSVYAEGAPDIDRAIFDAGVPVLGICYGFQVMAQGLGGNVGRTGGREFGRTKATVGSDCTLFAGQPGVQEVWMSHGDAVVGAPDGFRITAATDSVEIAAFEDPQRRLFGLQWHPEVRHTANGQAVLERFLYDGAGLAPNWTSSNIIADAVGDIRERVGAGHVICALSGGVDSAVAAAVVHEAVGDQLTCVFVDHGLLRKGEAEQVTRDYVAATGVRLKVVDASERFLTKLGGTRDPERKRKIIGREFIRVFEEAAAEIIRDEEHENDIEFLVQGTLYPDVVESGGGTGTANIKSHHNVGGLPKRMKFQLIEPLRWLFKDEVRELGTALGLPDALVWRQPFPGPGLAIRVIGKVTPENLAILREADAIAREEIDNAGLTRAVWQLPVVLLADVRSVGVQGDARTYGHPIVLRPVTSEDAMTADWARLPDDVLERISTRITNEIDEVNRVILDITSKPPASIEWE